MNQHAKCMDSLGWYFGFVVHILTSFSELYYLVPKAMLQGVKSQFTVRHCFEKNYRMFCFDSLLTLGRKREFGDIGYLTHTLCSPFQGPTIALRNQIIPLCFSPGQESWK